MQEKSKGNIAAKVAQLVKAAVEECGCILWDVEFVKEGQDKNLIIYIDKKDGISLDDCKMVNDAVEPIIDEADPISESYFLEISSPGIERELKTFEHIEAFLGQRVLVKLYAPRDGKKAFDGLLDSLDREKGSIVLNVNEEKIEFVVKECASIKTVCEF